MASQRRTIHRFSTFFMLILTFFISSQILVTTGPAAHAQEQKQAIGDISPLSHQSKIYTASENPDDILRIKELFKKGTLKNVMSNLAGKGLLVDFGGVLSKSVKEEEYFIAALKDESDKYLTEINNNELAFSFLVFSEKEIAILSEICVDRSSNEAHRIVLTNPEGNGLEINYLEKKVYKIDRSSSSNVHPAGAFGTVGCVIDALAGVLTPCNIGFLVGQTAICAAAIAALPVTAGVSAIIAIPDCASVILTIVQALVCAGVDCGLQSGGSFSLSASPFTQTINQGSSVVFNVTASFTGGFNQSVSNFQVSNLHPGASPSFSPNSITSSGGSVSLIIATNASTTLGTRTLTITATGGGQTKSTQVELNIGSSSGGGNCANPFVISAGTFGGNGNTAGGQSSFGTYNCSGWNESGPERVYRVTTTSSGTITASLSQLSADLDVFILSSCNANSCIAFGNNSASVSVGPGTYYIVVDGFNGVNGTYHLSVTSPVGSPPPTTPHIDNVTILSNVAAPDGRRQVAVRINGSGFNTSTVQVVVTGPGCQTFGPCTVPNNVLTGVSSTQIQSVPLTVGVGTYQVFVRNGASGTASNGFSINVTGGSSGTTLTGSVSNGQTWTQSFTVPSGRTALSVNLSWSGTGDLDLHLVSPNGHAYGYLEDLTGYSGFSVNPEFFNLANPQSGTWQVRVVGFSVPSGVIRSFTVTIQTQ